MKLILIVDDEIKYEDEQNNYDAEVYMDTDDFVLIFKSLKNIKPNFKDAKLMIEEDLSNKQEINKIIKEILSGKTEVETIVEIRNQKIDEFKYINKVFPTGCTIDVRDVNDDLLIKILKDVSFDENIKFLDKYNKYSKLSTLELKSCYDYIHQISKMINYYDFTPLEKLIFTFDMVREKIYKLGDTEDKSISRDIIQISNDDHIVCEGYANLVSSICTTLGIENEIAFWKKNDSYMGHATNIIYLNDEYYDIHEPYEIDVTFSSKKDENDIDYINNYRYFLFNFKEAYSIKNKNNYVNMTVLEKLLHEKIEDRRKSYSKLLAFNAPSILMFNSAKLLIEAVLEFATKIGNKELIDLCSSELSKMENECDFNCRNVDLIYQKFKELTESIIDKNKLFKAIYKVRRIEHLIDPIKYPLSIDVINDIYQNYFPKTKETLLLEMIFGEVDKFDFEIIGEIPIVSEIDEETSIDKINTDIKRIELLNIMKNELQNKVTKTKVKK